MKDADQARRTLLGLGAAALLLAGCAGPPPRVERYVPPPMGAVTAYQVTNSGSFGSAVRQVSVRMATQDWQGRRLLRYETPGGTTLQTDRVGVVAMLDPKDDVVATYEPPLDWPWPLEVGKTAVTRHEVVLNPGARRMTMTADWQIEALEDVTVPAGTFKAWKVVLTDSMGMRTTVWSLPDTLGMFARRTIERLPQHPQGAGQQVWVMTQRPTLP